MRTHKTRYGAGDPLSVPALRKDGERISVQFSIVPLIDANGTMTGMAAIMRDVTAELKSANDSGKRWQNGMLVSEQHPAPPAPTTSFSPVVVVVPMRHR